jgi:hypothetical protein
MGRLAKLAAKGKKAAHHAYDRVETRILVAEGRKSMKRKLATAGAVTRKAVKAGLVMGAATAAMVVAREIRDRQG